MHYIWSSGCSHSRLLEHLGLARKQWWWLVVVADSELAQLPSNWSFAPISLVEFWDLLDKHHVWKFCFHTLLLWLVFGYHRAHWRSLQQNKAACCIDHAHAGKYSLIISRYARMRFYIETIKDFVDWMSQLDAAKIINSLRSMRPCDGLFVIFSILMFANTFY